jgi:uncharacterized protein
MIIEFSFSNFRSFKNMTTLSMVAAPIHSKDKSLDENNVFKVDEKLSLLKSKAIYGANASGKSNIVKAMIAFIDMVRDCVKNEYEIEKRNEPFLLSSEANEPSFFQIIFREINAETTVLYRYGFEIFDGKIASEWLFEKSGRVEVPFFTREAMSVEVRSRFKEARKFGGIAERGDSKVFRKNSLFLTAVAALGGEFSKKIMDSIASIEVIGGLENVPIKNLVNSILREPKYKEFTLNFLQNADIDLEQIDVIETGETHFLNQDDLPKDYRTFTNQKIQKAAGIQTTRTIFNENGQKTGNIEGNLEDWESEGTQKLLYLTPFFKAVLDSGHPLIIDEFDARLHPLLTKKIVSLFNSSRTNPKGAQLIFVTHDTNLLKANLMRRDQICFVDKDKMGVSTLRTLVEYKGVRNDASFDKDYLDGRYEAVPFLNNLDHLSVN